MKIRLMGLPDEVARTLQVLHDAPGLDLVEVDGPYPNRGNSRMVRAYVEVRLAPDSGQARCRLPGGGAP